VTGWAIIAAAGLLAAAGYRYSLWRHPSTRCRWCGGTGRHRGAVYGYAAGPCQSKWCKGGRVPRWGVRMLDKMGDR
jgi:hypothetical protein